MTFNKFVTISVDDARRELDRLSRKFYKAGGRGIEMAERIDALRCALEDEICEFCESSEETRQAHAQVRRSIL